MTIHHLCLNRRRGEASGLLPFLTGIYMAERDVTDIFIN